MNSRYRQSDDTCPRRFLVTVIKWLWFYAWLWPQLSPTTKYARWVLAATINMQHYWEKAHNYPHVVRLFRQNHTCIIIWLILDNTVRAWLCRVTEEHRDGAHPGWWAGSRAREKSCSWDGEQQKSRWETRGSSRKGWFSFSSSLGFRPTMGPCLYYGLCWILLLCCYLLMYHYYCTFINGPMCLCFVLIGWEVLVCYCVELYATWNF